MSKAIHNFLFFGNRRLTSFTFGKTVSMMNRWTEENVKSTRESSAGGHMARDSWQWTRRKWYSETETLYAPFFLATVLGKKRKAETRRMQFKPTTSKQTHSNLCHIKSVLQYPIHNMNAFSVSILPPRYRKNNK